jgi:phosphoribosylformylglycinamidine cyclo-ligase
MNVNDLICVGAEPIALVDYLAVEEVDAGRLARIGQGLKAGAEAAGCEIPGGELAVLPELIKGHPSPHGFDLCATAIGTVKIDDIILGDRIAPGDAVIGVPSSGLHSNGYTLARRALQEQGGLSLDDRPTALGGLSVADALLEPTVIYVRAVLELLRSDVDVRGLAHITGGGLNNMLRLGAGFVVEDPLPVPPIFGLVAQLGEVSEAEMWEVFNMGCGLTAIVPGEQADAASEILAARHPGARRIGTATDTGTVAVPSLGLTFPLR